MAKILVIEDETAIRSVLCNILSDENDSYEVEQASDGKEGLSKISMNDYDLVLCDIKMPKISGTEVLSKCMEIKPETAVIMISGHGDIDTAVECMKVGAYDFISKPPDLNQLLNAVRNAIDKKDLVVENKVLKTENKILKKKVSKKYTMIGESAPMQEIKEMIGKVAQTDARILITGPNGTGKELVAHQIHEQSQRNKSPLIEVNCAAIPSELIESELFGHEKGSFTGAHKQKKGKFELANKGTIFLDEIGDMSLSAQAKVLRALQESRISRVGADKEINVDVRVLAATNKNLKEEIEKGNFREDLYHRLAVILIKVPSLNERPKDIPLLMEYFKKQIANDLGLPEKDFEPKAIKALQEIDWTGNIREFKNVIERLNILGGDIISLKDVQKYASK